jgi:hypothetical protein
MGQAVISVRKLCEGLFEIVPPTAPAADIVGAAISPELGDLMRRTLHASYDEAVGAAVAYASAMDWRVHDATGRLSAERLAMAVEMYPAARDEGRL